MSPAGAAPAPDNQTLISIARSLAALEERTSDLKQMGQTVIRTEQRVAALEASMEKHDREMRSLSQGVQQQDVALATTKSEWKGEWKGITVVASVVVGVFQGAIFLVKLCLHK
jgi:hypothetical protein